MGTYSGGAGTELSPYQIGTQADLVELYGTSADWSAYFKQTADIDLTSQATWTNIGNATTKFTGEYDGNSAIISNLSVDQPNLIFGFFGYTDSATFKNITLDNFYIDNCYLSRPTIFISVADTSTITKCVVKNSTLRLVGSGGAASAIFVSLLPDSTIDECIVENCDIVIDGSDAIYAGLFCADAEDGVVTNCKSTGTLTENVSNLNIGGFVSLNDNENVVNSIAIVNYDGTVSPHGSGFSADTGCATCYFDSDVADFTTSRGGFAKTTSLMKTESTFVGYDFDDIWVMGEDGYPELQWYAGGGGGSGRRKSGIMNRMNIVNRTRL